MTTSTHCSWIASILTVRARPPLRASHAAILCLLGCGGGSSAPQTNDAGVLHDAGLKKDALPEVAADVPPPVTKRVFITREGWNGDLVAAGKASTPTASADALCAEAATLGKVSGTWHAWISTSTSNAADRIDLAASRVMLDGTKVFDPASANGLIPLTRLLVDEYGGKVSQTAIGQVWTATDVFGHYETNKGPPLDDACKQWTSASSSVGGTAGVTGAIKSDTGVDEDWTDGWNNTSCDGISQLYCFEE
jgi:hypothetical protein